MESSKLNAYLIFAKIFAILESKRPQSIEFSTGEIKILITIHTIVCVGITYLFT